METMVAERPCALDPRWCAGVPIYLQAWADRRDGDAHTGRAAVRKGMRSMYEIAGARVAVMRANREDTMVTEEETYRSPTEPEKRAWVAGKHLPALRAYRGRVHPDRGLEAVVVVFEEATGVKRTFQVLPTAYLGRPCGNPDCCDPREPSTSKHGAQRLRAKGEETT